MKRIIMLNSPSLESQYSNVNYDEKFGNLLIFFKSSSFKKMESIFIIVLSWAEYKVSPFRGILGTSTGYVLLVIVF